MMLIDHGLIQNSDILACWKKDGDENETENDDVDVHGNDNNNENEEAETNKNNAKSKEAKKHSNGDNNHEHSFDASYPNKSKLEREDGEESMYNVPSVPDNAYGNEEDEEERRRKSVGMKNRKKKLIQSPENMDVVDEDESDEDAYIRKYNIYKFSYKINCFLCVLL